MGMVGREAMVWLDPTRREKKEGVLKLTSWSKGTGRNILADMGRNILAEEGDSSPDVECEENTMEESCTPQNDLFYPFVSRGNRLDLRKCFVNLQNLHIRNPTETVNLNLLINANRTTGGILSNFVPEADCEKDDITDDPQDDDCQIVEVKQSSDGRKLSKKLTPAIGDSVDDGFYNSDLTYHDDPDDEDYQPQSPNDEDYRPEFKKRKYSGSGNVKKKKTEKWSFNL